MIIAHHSIVAFLPAELLYRIIIQTIFKEYFSSQDHANQRSRRVSCGRRSSVQRLIELGEVQRRKSSVGVLEPGLVDQLEEERLPRGGSSVIERSLTGVADVRRRRSNVGAQSLIMEQFKENQDDVQEDSKMMQNWDDKGAKTLMTQNVPMEEFKDI